MSSRIVEFTIKNWASYNGRADVKHATWFRCSNSLLEDPDLFGESTDVILVWLYILSHASKKATATPSIHVGHCAAVCRVSEEAVFSAIKKLTLIGWLLEPSPKADEILALNLKKAKARNAVKTAVKNGELTRPECCDACGKNSYRIEAHHEDYNAPLNVVWLCTTCHGLVHTSERTRTRATGRGKMRALQTDRQTDNTLSSGDDPASADRHPLADLWNENCGTLPKVRELNSDRRKKCAARWKECADLNDWKAVIKYIASSKFHTGQNDRGWTANFDYLLKPKTRIEISERLQRKPSGESGQWI